MVKEPKVVNSFVPKPKVVIDPRWRTLAHAEEFDDFDYFDNTDYDNLDADMLDRICWIFFTIDGSAYILNKVIETSYSGDFDDARSLGDRFVSHFAVDTNRFYDLLNLLQGAQVLKVKMWLLFLLEVIQKEFSDFGLDGTISDIKSLLKLISNLNSPDKKMIRKSEEAIKNEFRMRMKEQRREMLELERQLGLKPQEKT